MGRCRRSTPHSFIPFYQLHPGFGQLRPMLAAAAAAAGGQAAAERPGSGGKSFTIDAILGRDGNVQTSESSHTSTTATSSTSPRAQSVMAPGSRDSGVGSSRLGPATAALGVLQHRQHRLQSAGHPYLTTLAQCTAPLGFRSAFSSARGKNISLSIILTIFFVSSAGTFLCIFCRQYMSLFASIATIVVSVVDFR